MKTMIMKGKELNPFWKGYVVVQNFGKNVGRIFVDGISKKEALQFQKDFEKESFSTLKKEYNIF